MNPAEILEQNEALMEALAEIKTVDDLAALLTEHGINPEEGVDIETLFAQLKAEPGDELGENDLENVSGGVLMTPIVIGGAIALAYRMYKRKKGRSSGGGGHGSFGSGGSMGSR